MKIEYIDIHKKKKSSKKKRINYRTKLADLPVAVQEANNMLHGYCMRQDDFLPVRKLVLLYTLAEGMDWLRFNCGIFIKSYQYRQLRQFLACQIREKIPTGAPKRNQRGLRKTDYSLLKKIYKGRGKATAGGRKRAAKNAENTVST